MPPARCCGARQIAANLGKMDFVWRTNFGDNGHLQADQIQRKVPPADDLELIALRVLDERVVVETPFQLRCCLANRSNRKMSIRLYAMKTTLPGIVINGVSGQHVGDLVAGGHHELDLQLFAHSPGLQSVVGLLAVDTLTGKSYELGGALSVFVYRHGR